MVRVIPRLDIKGPNLVKGIHLEGLRIMGKPEVFARQYYKDGADELIYMDVVASLYRRNNLLDIVSRTAREIFIPLTVGGGIRTLDDIRAVLRAGADKVALNTAVIKQPHLISEAARMFGSSTIVVSIEAIKRPDGNFEAYTDNGRESTGVNALEWASRSAELGAGEILITSIDREGTGKGFALDLTGAVAKALSIPIVACGGGGTVQHVEEVVSVGMANAVCLASMFHYHYLKTCNKEEVPFQEGNIEFLKGAREFSKVRGISLRELKKNLIDRGIECRPLAEAKVGNA